jgi:surface protein
MLRPTVRTTLSLLAAILVGACADPVSAPNSAAATAFARSPSTTPKENQSCTVDGGTRKSGDKNSKNACASNFSLAVNGVTILCPNAAVGESGTVNGVTYTKRTKEQITEANAATTCTSGITDMSQLFFFKQEFNGDIRHWDTGAVTDMSGLFNAAFAFNQPLAYWNTSNVTSMRNMFAGARAFNQPIGAWDTEKVTDMRAMFYNTPVFNQDISGWNTGNVVDMESMFDQANVFNQPIGNWNTAKVTKMNAMFTDAFKFNQPIGSWKTSSIADMSWMFSVATDFNQDLSSWCVYQIAAQPTGFDNATSSWSSSNKPRWGDRCRTLVTLSDNNATSCTVNITFNGARASTVYKMLGFTPSFWETAVFTSGADGSIAWTGTIPGDLSAGALIGFQLNYEENPGVFGTDRIVTPSSTSVTWVDNCTSWSH